MAGQTCVVSPLSRNKNLLNKKNWPLEHFLWAQDEQNQQHYHSKVYNNIGVYKEVRNSVIGAV